MEELLCKKCGVIGIPNTEKKGPHLKAMCSSCGSYIKFISQGKDYIFYFGKYKGETLKDVAAKDSEYIVWCIENLDKKVSSRIEKAVNELNNIK